MSPRERQQAHAQRSLLFLAIFAGSLGSCGACNAAAGFNDLPYVAADTSLSAEVAAGHQAINHIKWSNPHRKGLSLAGVIVSLMLMVGGYMLISRRENARWWLRNSIGANLVWTGLQAVSQYMHIRGAAPEIREVIRSVETSEEWTHGPSALANDVLVAAALHAGVLFYLLWRLGREDPARIPVESNDDS